MITLERKIDGSNIAVVEYKELQTTNDKELLEIFNYFKGKGILKNQSFEDNTWRMTNETTVISVEFALDEIKHAKEVQNREILKYRDFIRSLKAFTLFKLYSNVLRSIAESINNIIWVLNETSFFNMKYKENVIFDNIVENSYFKQLSSLLDYLEFTEMETHRDFIDLFAHQMEQYCQLSEDRGFNKRDLGDFSSIFKMGEILDLFWEESTIIEKEEFFPIKLWWEITTIIPLRVTELTVTPLDCLEEKKGYYYLKLRRSKLKGNIAEPKHIVEEDYEIHTIRISEDLYKLIESYKTLVEKYDYDSNYYGEFKVEVGPRKYLFSPRSYFKFLDSAGKSTSVNNSLILDLFGYSNLKTLLSRFYRKIVRGRFNYQVLLKAGKQIRLSDAQIEMVSPMDTRHHAMINMSLNDIEPIIMKNIAGHKDVNIGIHYASHLERFVECYTYSMAKKLVLKKNRESGKDIIQIEYESNVDLLVNEIIFKKELEYRDVEGGKCSSSQSLNNLVDCRKRNFVCLDGCKFFHSDNDEFIKRRIEKNEQELKVTINSLQQLIDHYKKVVNLEEKYGQKVAKIKSIANQNAYLISQYLM